MIKWVGLKILGGINKPANKPMNNMSQPAKERFWKKVDKSGGKDSCWPWTGMINHGYGRVYRHGYKYSHRVSYELNIGEIPDGFCVLHKCDNPPCVNPSHLFLGTHAENMADCSRKGRFAKSKRKFTKLEIESINQEYDSGNANQHQIARKYGVHYISINKIISRFRSVKFNLR